MLSCIVRVEYVDRFENTNFLEVTLGVLEIVNWALQLVFDALATANAR